MHTETGNILSPELMDALKRAEARDRSDSLRRELAKYREMHLPPTDAQLRRGRVGRNEPCPCGSGKKFKTCCLRPTSS